MSSSGSVPAGQASEAAVEAAKEAVKTELPIQVERADPRNPERVEEFWLIRCVLAAAHDPALEGRSVNERWCREDQTRRIVGRLREIAGLGDDLHQLDAFELVARFLAREFGGGPDA